jgi:hypothetical protein
MNATMCYIYSDEDTDVRALVTSWLMKQKDEQYREHLRSWIDEYYYKALDIVLKIVRYPQPLFILYRIL